MIQEPTKHPRRPRRKLIIAGPVFTLSLFTISLTIGGIWLSGLKEHHSLYHNALLSTSTLATAFFIFISISLYQGFKLKDELGDIISRVSFRKLPEPRFEIFDFPVGGDSIFGIIAGFIIAVVLSLVLCFLLWLLGTVLWALLLLLTALLYRVFFRGLRFVFRHGAQCRGRLQRSIIYGLGYTGLYSCWVYGIIFALHYLHLHT